MAVSPGRLQAAEGDIEPYLGRLARERAYSPRTVASDRIDLVALAGLVALAMQSCSSHPGKGAF